MRHSNEFSEMVDEGKEFIKKESKPLLREGKDQIKQSGTDWLAYVETHPIQTLLFGVIGYFALKGILKD